uniref:Uncharacterized protein n=1 Tax=Oreochromis niloticus TaxID=8128 RepID=A0A669CHJ1_ORENI
MTIKTKWLESPAGTEGWTGPSDPPVDAEGWCGSPEPPAGTESWTGPSDPPVDAEGWCGSPEPPAGTESWTEPQWEQKAGRAPRTLQRRQTKAGAVLQIPQWEQKAGRAPRTLQQRQTKAGRAPGEAEDLEAGPDEDGTAGDETDCGDGVGTADGGTAGDGVGAADGCGWTGPSDPFLNFFFFLTGLAGERLVDRLLLDWWRKLEYPEKTHADTGRLQTTASLFNVIFLKLLFCFLCMVQFRYHLR